MLSFLKAVVTAITILAIVVGVIVFAGVFKKIFMSLCFFGILCCFVGIVYSFQQQWAREKE